MGACYLGIRFVERRCQNGICALLAHAHTHARTRKYARGRMDDNRGACYSRDDGNRQRFWEISFISRCDNNNRNKKY